MEYIRHEIEDVIEIIPTVYKDERGAFSEVYNKKDIFKIIGCDSFVQDNHSISKPPFVIRGLHFQIPPKAQGKLVRVLKGRILDVAVDIRHGSPTFGQHVMVELSTEKWNQLWVPPGFAHGFCTLEPNTEVLYKVTEYYSPEHERGLLFSDPALDIKWPVSPEEAVVKERDRNFPLLKDLPPYFHYDAKEK